MIRNVAFCCAVILCACTGGTQDRLDSVQEAFDIDTAVSTARVPQQTLTSLPSQHQFETASLPEVGRPVSLVAAMPDHGKFLQLDSAEILPAFPENVSYQVAVSEAHARRRAKLGETLTIQLPDATETVTGYIRHVRHFDGSWTWVGMNASGESTVITFGPDAVFGTVGGDDGAYHALTTAQGKVWMVVPSQVHPDPDYLKDDVLIPPPHRASNSRVSPPNPASRPHTIEPPVVDIVVGYSPGFANEYGGVSQAQTRIVNLVEQTNQSYSASLLQARLRLLRTLRIPYSEESANVEALEDMRTSTEFAPLRDLRERLGADLVSFIRPYVDSHLSGGIAYLLGMNGEIPPYHADYGFSMISDSPQWTAQVFAHEIGHNLGQHHDVENTSGLRGVHPYSHGYREDSDEGFHTIMAYAKARQFSILRFSNPSHSYKQAITGVADESDTVRSMAVSIPMVAGFRNAKGGGLFSDVLPDFWAYNEIYRIYDAGITSGCATSPLNRYCPHSPTARDAMAIFILRGKYGPDYFPPAAQGIFDDVPTSHWAASWIEQLYREGIVGGCRTSPLMYCPAAPVTREQMAVMLTKAGRSGAYFPPPPTGRFQDVAIDRWSAPWIEQLVKDGVTGGCQLSPPRYCPEHATSRDQMAAFLVRKFNISQP